MLSAFTGWLLTNGISLILGALVRVAQDAYSDMRSREEARTAGRTEEALKQIEAARRVEADLADQATKKVSDDEALDRLEKGSA